MLIADLRKELGLSLEALGGKVGIASRGRMSVIERENACSLDVALKLEELSGGRLDAGTICEDVRRARLALADGENQAAVVLPPHGSAHNGPEEHASTGQADEMSGRAVA